MQMLRTTSDGAALCRMCIVCCSCCIGCVELAGCKQQGVVMCSRDGVGVDAEGAGGGVLMLVAEPQESWDLCRRSSWPERSACPIKQG